jgi:hypothetical protein
MLVALRLGGMLVVGRSGVLLAGAFGTRRILGMSRVFFGVLGVDALVMRAFFVSFFSGGRCCGGYLDGGRVGQGHRRQRLVRLNLAVSVIVLVVSMFMFMLMLMLMIMFMFVIMAMFVRMFMTFMVMMAGIGVLMFGIVRVAMIVVGVQTLVIGALIRLRGCRGIGAGVVDDLALDPLAIAAAARIAVAWTAAAVAGPILGFFLGFAMGALVSLDQRLTVGDRDLIIIRVNFAEGQEAVAVAAIFDEGGLQRRLYAGDLGEVDVTAQLLALGGLEVKLFDAIAADDNDPGLFRVGSIDQHFVGHFGTLDGGGRVFP